MEEEEEEEVGAEDIMREMTVVEVSTATEGVTVEVIFTLLWSAWTVRATEPTSSWWGGGR